jgi:hypothetical protein
VAQLGVHGGRAAVEVLAPLAHAWEGAARRPPDRRHHAGGRHRGRLVVEIGVHEPRPRLNPLHQRSPALAVEREQCHAAVA